MTRHAVVDLALSVYYEALLPAAAAHGARGPGRAVQGVPEVRASPRAVQEEAPHPRTRCGDVGLHRPPRVTVQHLSHRPPERRPEWRPRTVPDQRPVLVLAAGCGHGLRSQLRPAGGR